MIDLVCWDFGDTLVDERWMRLPHPEYPTWAADYDQVMDADPGWVTAWEQGRAGVEELVERLHVKTGLAHASITGHIAAACRGVRFFPAVLAAAEELRGQVAQACVTVNPDVFTSYVVPAFQLESLFDVIVTSWETGLMDKSPMALRARKLLGLSDHSLGTTLLIDNKAANVEEFRAAGGLAYHFRGEEAFVADHHDGLPGLVAAG